MLRSSIITVIVYQSHELHTVRVVTIGINSNDKQICETIRHLFESNVNTFFRFLIKTFYHQRGRTIEKMLETYYTPLERQLSTPAIDFKIP